MNIQPANETDLHQLVQIKPYWGDNEMPAQIVRRRISETQANRGVYLVAKVENQFVGHVFLKYYGKRSAPYYPDVEDLYVQEPFRRQGVATALLQRCEELARSAGYCAIGLAAGVDENGLERHLYQKLGYALTDNAPYVDGVYNGVEDWVVDMKKVLA